MKKKAVCALTLVRRSKWPPFRPFTHNTHNQYQLPHSSSPLSADELIRQVTVHCGERGQVLVRIRDELQATVGAYQTLYESGVAFGMRKALTSDRDKAELSAHAAVLEAEVGDLEATVAALEARAAELAAQEEGPGSAAAAVEAAHQAEAGALRAAIAATKEALETALAPPPMAAAVPK